MMKIALTSLITAAVISLPPASWAQSRKETLASCDKISRKFIRNKYLSDSDVQLLSLVSWLSGEQPDRQQYKFATYAKIRNEIGELYSWTFSSHMEFDGKACTLLSEKFENSTKLVEDDGEEMDLFTVKD